MTIIGLCWFFVVIAMVLLFIVGVMAADNTSTPVAFFVNIISGFILFIAVGHIFCGYSGSIYKTCKEGGVYTLRTIVLGNSQNCLVLEDTKGTLIMVDILQKDLEDNLIKIGDHLVATGHKLKKLE